MQTQIDGLLEQPHKLGHLLGFTDLQPFHSEWIKAYWLGSDALQAHRNSFKTTSCIEVGYLWYSLLYPESTVLLIREEMTNAMNTVVAISQLLQGPEMLYLYRELYGIKDFVLKKDNKDSIVLPTKRVVTIEGSLDSSGVGSSLTGRHYDKIICDDIITVKDRISKATRDQKKLFIMELENIKKSSGSISISGTPWHKDDGFSLFDNIRKFPIGSIHIPGMTAERVEEIRKRTTASLFAANYMLKHISNENRIFPDPVYGEFKCISPMAWLDPAYNGTNCTALTMVDDIAGTLYVKGWVWRQDVTELYDKIVTILGNHSCGSLYVETNADKGLSVRDLSRVYPAVIGKNEHENKHIKIVSWAKQYWPDIVFASDCQDEYLTQVLDYEEGQEPDDAPDSLASMIREIKKYHGSSETSGGYSVESEWMA